ncbi:MAG: amidohydrolase [Gammaproteobacteria bacterium CG22_combo_CG10-13_8_21_14_all_40_8]|nr:MAG: amidohydrolase [Gammaproteobacteria bacterium CG22_combo_CG10-13_8_21_14_all_40_8]
MKKIIALAVSGLTLILTSQNAVAQCQLYQNIKGYTPTSHTLKLTQFDWLAFDQGKVLATGIKGTTNPYQHCQPIDGHQQFMLPGLIDAHGHIAGLGFEMLSVNLRGIASEALAVDAVKNFATKNPASQWIKGGGWNQVLWQNKHFPHRDSLDKSGIKKPILLERVDGHAVWVNSQALALAGINKETPDPQGGKIERDENGEATGVLIDNAMEFVRSKIPPISAAEQEIALDKAFAHLLSLGIVNVHDAGVDEKVINSYIERNKTDRLPIRIYAMLDGSSQKLTQWLDRGIISDHKDFLSIRSVKLYADGALGSRGAALLAPYSDDIQNTGLLRTPTSDLDTLVHHILSKGFQVNVHAIGDKANRLVLDAFEKAYKTVNAKSLRNRIEHAQVVSLKDISRFKSLNIIASMQPVHATSDKNMAEDRLGKERLKGAYAWYKFLQQGTIIASGSDFPVELANVFHGLHAAITRQDHTNQPKGGWLADEKMTPAQALRSFTLDAAYAAHQEKTLGSLETGKWADFVLINQDVIHGKMEDIWKTQVFETWVSGEKRYTKN